MGIKRPQAIIIESILKAFNQRPLQVAVSGLAQRNVLDMGDLIAVTGLSGEMVDKAGGIH
jgi:hypothetical protein